MKIKIIGITKEMKSGVSRKNQKPYSGYFISYGYRMEDVDGLKTDSFLYSADVMRESNGYIPVPGDLCDLVYGRGGFIEGMKPLGKGELN